MFIESANVDSNKTKESEIATISHLSLIFLIFTLSKIDLKNSLSHKYKKKIIFIEKCILEKRKFLSLHHLLKNQKLPSIPS